MLNENQLYNNKLKFLELLGKLNIDLTSLVKYLDANDYFNKPASSQYLGLMQAGFVSMHLTFIMS
jgi:hypothetical protein